MNSNSIIADSFGGFCNVADLAKPEAATDLAIIFRKRLRPRERLTLASAAMQSLDSDSRDTLIRTAERGKRAEQVFRRAWPAAGRDRHG